MGAPAHLVLPDPSQQRSSSPSPFSPGGSIFSPTETDSWVTSSSSTDSASSSFTQSFPRDADSARQILTKAEKKKDRPKKKDVLEGNVGHKNSAKLKHIMKSTPKEPLRESKRPITSCTTGGSMRKACCRCAGAFAADCAALCCCPCVVLSLLAFVLVELPSTVGRKLVTHLQKRLCIKEPTSVRSSRSGDNSHTIFTPTWSYREPSEGEGEKQAVSIIRFDTQNLLKHFDAEHVGFGCLSQKREEVVSCASER